MARAWRPRRRQDKARRRMGARAGARPGTLCRGGLRPDRAGRRERARRARGHDRGTGRPAAHRAAQRTAAVDLRRADGWNGPTARWRKPFRPTTPKACAGRNSMPPGATNSPSGAMPTPPSTCCNSGCGWGHARANSSPPRHGRSRCSNALSPIRSALCRARAHIANAAHLSPAFLDEVLARYAGTRLGRQEIDGEIVEDRPDALWSRAMIEAARVAVAPPLARIVVGIDPPASSRPNADACGIVAAGRAEDGCVYVLEDATVKSLAPSGWASRAIALYRRLKADALVAEVNQGGEMVGAVLRNVDAFGAAENGARDARQISARRASGGSVCARPRQARGAAERGAGGSDVRLRARRAVVGRFARPARRAGLGGDGVDGEGVGGAEDQGVVTLILRCERSEPRRMHGQYL